MNSQQNKSQNSEKLIDDLFNLCKKPELIKIENLLSNNNNKYDNYIIDEAIRILIRNYVQENKEFQKSLKYLLKINNNINFKNESQTYATILMEACCSEKIEPFDIILEFFDILPKNNNYEIIEKNIHNNKKINKSINTKKFVNTKNKNFMQDSLNSINYLDLNIKDNDGQTVLHRVINSSNLDDDYKFICVKKLIKKGADVNEENILGYTPLALALLLGNSYLSEYLINSDANIFHEISFNNDNMLHCAVRGKNPAILHLLDGIDLKHKNKNGETPIDLANNLKLLSFIDEFKKIDMNNSEINLNNKIISSMLPINDILNKNYTQVILRLEDLKSSVKITNSELRFIWNSLLAEYHEHFENQLILNNRFTENNELKKIENINYQDQESLKIKEIEYKKIKFNSSSSGKNSILQNKIFGKENILNGKNRLYFIQKFLEFLNNKENYNKDHNQIFFYNSGLFWYKIGNYKKSIENLLKCLGSNSKNNNFLFFMNASLLLINLFQNIQEYFLSGKIIENIEDFINDSTNSFKNGNKTNCKDERVESIYVRSLYNLFTQIEIINKFNVPEELNCLLNILKSQNFLYEEKIEDSKRFLKEFKRLSNILNIKESFPLLETFNKFYRFEKIKIHYLNNSISRSYKHLNKFSEIKNDNNQENLILQIIHLNSVGIINLKSKKFFSAEFYFKKALNILMLNPNKFNINTNIKILAENILFNLSLVYFYEKKYEECYTTLKKINGKIINNPFYFYRLGLSCLEIELQSIKSKSNNCYSEILEKFLIEKSQFNIDDSENGEKILINIDNPNSEFETKYENENKNYENNNNKKNISYSSCYILKNFNIEFLESKKIFEAIEYFSTVILLIKNINNLNYQNEISEVYKFYKINQDEQGILNKKNNLKFYNKSYNNILISSYLNVIFCFSLKNKWNDMLFFINDLENSNLPIKDISYTIDNYKMEAYLGLNQSLKVIELLKKNMLNGNYTYNCLDNKGKFLSKVTGNIYDEINFKIALYSNVIKLNFLNDNILEVEKGIVKIFGLYNMNFNLNQNMNNQIENINLPSYLINILIYYYLIKENYETAIYLIRKRKLPENSLNFLINDTKN